MMCDLVCKCMYVCGRYDTNHPTTDLFCMSDSDINIICLVSHVYDKAPKQRVPLLDQTALTTELQSISVTGFLSLMDQA